MEGDSAPQCEGLSVNPQAMAPADDSLEATQLSGLEYSVVTSMK